ncbi:MAG: family metallopeptidase [Microbacterium sp.]|jgi:murein DD-endopeptidase MepM/ murein hydrolase activator NlpD|nr:family metallopeptidase [Microbacterium sp.]
MAGPGAALVLLNPKVVRVVVAAGILVLASVGAALFLLVAVFSGAAQGTPQPAPTGPGTVFPVTGEWTTPVGGPYSITSRYGYRPDVIPHDHFGVDLAQGCGQPILAASAGEVTFAGSTTGGWGERVKIKHSESVTTAYAHMTFGSITVKEGDRVAPGQVIGAEGATGVGTGCHLHFEVYLDGKRINPEPFMAQQGIVF